MAVATGLTGTESKSFYHRRERDTVIIEGRRFLEERCEGVRSGDWQGKTG